MARILPEGAGLPRSFRGGLLGILIPIFLLGLMFTAVIRSTPREEPSPAARAVTAFVPVFERLPVVPDGHYELWIERPGGGQQRLASFTALPGGALLTLSGEPVQAFPVEELPPSGSKFLLTVEPGDQDVDRRSDRILLEGVLKETAVALSPIVPSADGQQVAILVAPTDTQAPDTTGLWFAKPGKIAGRPEPGLTLPPLSAGWAYGGFVTTASGASLRTGLFADPAKEDAAAPFSGKRRGLRFPGEDFIANPPPDVVLPLNLADGRTTVTVGLQPDFTAAAEEPFLPLLQARVPFQQEPNKPFALEPADAGKLPAASGIFESRTP